MGANQGCVARKRRPRGSDGEKQPVVCRSGVVSLSCGHSVEGFAGTLWRLSGRAHALQSLEPHGGWKRLFESLSADADNEYAMIDATIVRAHQHSAGAKKQTGKANVLDAAPEA